ncbi:uncharacterized membrane protein YsdA (DUF1294 family) [Acinetobacter calcoaceticus]|uniref:Uncharacterized membrane protein YsdA (DUF1294 family) n=1 Tax=Acinetobacter calcoaceticus TaxID=471 RepID=A0A4R1Y766_ACICA|nr:uncharacterized membrane protein YsdA (DUF1294 family) [Acinetobacter calcoaceticus]
MRDQGRLVEWFDDQGYGFIQPLDTTKSRVFLHVKDFARQGPRPIIGCGLDYQVSVDGKGRYRATEVVYLKAAQTKTKPAPSQRQAQPQKSALQPMQILISVYIIALGILAVMGMLPNLLMLFLVLINVICYWCYAQDKEAAQLGRRRIPEQSLHILAFLGGWPAAWLAQQRLRHKTQKQPFRKIYHLTIVFHLILLIWFISPLNVLRF